MGLFSLRTKIVPKSQVKIWLSAWILTKLGIRNELENQREQNFTKKLASNQTKAKSDQRYQNLAWHASFLTGTKGETRAPSQGLEHWRVAYKTATLTTVHTTKRGHAF